MIGRGYSGKYDVNYKIEKRMNVLVWRSER
jgi:hypothetical protein